ncbi:MAG: energy-coupling factor ABC transporter permease [Thermofilum sp.]
MHIPDGFLDPVTSAATYALFLGYGLLAVRKARIEKGESRHLVPVLAAGIFAAQMINWPLPGGTSFHFVGGALAGILLGPWLGFLAMALVLLVQTLVFHDGGITALGANMLNMAIIAVLAGYLVYRAFPARLKALGAFAAGWLSVTLAGLACGVELGLSSQFLYGLGVAVPVMAGWHAALGIIEGAITAAVYSYLRQRAPALLRG